MLQLDERTLVGVSQPDMAVWFVAVCWSLAAVVFIFLLLRLYTRIRYISAYGVDDWLFLAAFVSQELPLQAWHW